MRFFTLFQQWLASHCAATAIEYGLIMAAIAVAISAIVLSLGGEIGSTFSSSADLIAQGN